MSKKTFLVSIILLFCLANVSRWAFRSGLAYPRFVAEGAAHLRYTEIVASGRAVPPVDAQAQWPEGLEVYRETAVGMEYLYGLVYRLVPGGRYDLPTFVRFFTAFVFSLSIFPLAFISSGLWRSNAAGALTAVLFAVALPVVGRSSGFELIRENVTLPLLVYHFYFFYSAESGGGLWKSILSGLFLAFALATWQGTQFYLVPFLLFLVLRRLLGFMTNSERRTVRLLILFIIAAGAGVPFLRESWFLLSIPVALSAAWLALDLLLRGNRAEGPESGATAAGRVEVRRTVLGALLASVALTSVLLPGFLLKEHFASYSHFFKLVIYKLMYIDKPTDPGVLPFDVRAFWVGPFHSPDPRHIFVFALPVIMLLPWPVSRLAGRVRSGEFPASFVLTFLILFFALFLLMQRLLPFFGIFAVLAAGGCALAMKSAAGNSVTVKSSLAVVVCVVAISLMQNFAWEGPADIWRRAAKLLRVPYRDKFVVFPYAGDVEGALLSWIRHNTDKEAVIMSLHYLSPQVLTYTGRATNLNDFFESPRLRRKAERFLKLLYASESGLLRFCEEQSSDYLLVSSAVGCDPTRDSPLYQAGLMDIPPGCAAYRLLFEPDRLKSFNLVYENEMYRLFRVGEGNSERNWPRSPLFYDSELLWQFDGDIRTFYNSVMRVYALSSRGRFLAASGLEKEAERMLTEALRIFYFYPAWRELDDLYKRQGRLKEKEALSEFAYHYDPNRIDVCIELARDRLDLGKREGVRELLERCTSLQGSRSQHKEVDRLLDRLEGHSP